MSADTKSPDKAEKNRRSESWARRFSDSYTLVFIGIIFTLLILATLGERDYGKALGVALLSAVFLLTLAASSVRPSMLRLAILIVVPVTLAAIIATAQGSDAVASGASLAVSALLVIASPVVIAQRLVRHRQITLSTVSGSLCIYLFVGLLFAFVYAGVDLLSDPDVFAQLSSPTSVDYIYFSFTTLTTLGYGDLSPALGFAKMSAIIEAILGQLYLVTIVAIVVGHLGSKRQPPQ